MDVATATATPSGGTPASAPATFADAFAADASPASTPSSPATTPADAAVPPTGTEATPTPDDRSPFIPRARFDEVNTRREAAEQWKQQHAWAAQIPQDELQQAIQLAKRASVDPIGYMQEFISDLQRHPEHGQALRSLAARALSAGRGQTPATMPQADVAITDANGNVVGQTYSEKALAQRDAYLMQQVMAKVDEKYAPVVKTHEQITADQQKAIDKAAGEQFASTFMGELETYPQFETHKDAIGQEVVRMLSQYPKTDPRLNHPAFLEATTLRAYQKVVGPKLHASTESSVLDSLQRKAAASSSVNPGSAAPATPRSPSSFFDPGLTWK